MDVFLEDLDILPLLEEVRSLIVPVAEKNGNTLEIRDHDGVVRRSVLPIITGQHVSVQ